VSKSLETVTCIRKYQSSSVDSSNESSSEHELDFRVVPESDCNADKAAIVPQPSTSNKQVISHQLRRKLPTLVRVLRISFLPGLYVDVIIVRGGVDLVVILSIYS